MMEHVGSGLRDGVLTMMQYRKLGRTGITVSEIGFGAWGIGGRTAGQTSYGVTDDAISRNALTNPAAASGSAIDSRCTVAENCGDSGRKRTCTISCRRAAISAFNSALGSCFQWVRVVRIIGPG